MTTTVTFLGTGTSVGVPVIGCDCTVCSSGNPRNIRTRCSLYLQSESTSLLVDSGPDLREQALRENIRTVDAVLYTHAHLDHISGFDELRAFCWSRDEPLPLHAGPDTHQHLHRMFPWAFENRKRGYIRPKAEVIDGPFSIGDFEITPVPVEHGGFETFGFRFLLPSGQSLAYLSDVKSIPESSAALLQELDVLIIDALRPDEHPTHLSIAESLAVSQALAPSQTFFTHLSHDIDYNQFSAELPAGIALAVDGLRLNFKPHAACARVDSQPTARE